MISRLIAFAWLLFIWVALVGSLSPGNLLMGALLSAALLSFFRPLHTKPTPLPFRPLHAARFAMAFAVKFIEANIQVALAVIQPDRIRRRRAVVAVPIVGASRTTTVLLANVVTLTPGTFILEVRHDPPTLYVHVLQLASVRASRLSILEMERLIVKAIGPPGAGDRVSTLIASVAADDNAEGRPSPWRP